MEGKEIIIRKRFPRSTQLLSIVGLIFSIWQYKEYEYGLAFIPITLFFSVLTDINVSMRKKEKLIEIGNSLFGMFFTKHKLLLSEISTLSIKQNESRQYLVGFEMNSKAFFELDKRTTLDKLEEVKDEIEEKIRKNWRQQ